jgi:hypothetical protein
MQENPAAIEGGDMPREYRPAENIAKAMVYKDESSSDSDSSSSSSESSSSSSESSSTPSERSSSSRESSSTPSEWGSSSSESSTTSDEIEEVEEETPEDEGWVEEEESEEGTSTSRSDTEELKSILKDIRSALAVNQAKTAEVMKAEIKKSLPNMVKGETDKMLRKMGFVPTRPDVVKMDAEGVRGIDSVDEVKKSEDIKKSEDDVYKIVDDLSKKSWTELGQIREKSGGFHLFGS